jgi:hypothetical protein
MKPEEARRIWKNCVDASNEGDDVVAKFISVIEPLIRLDEREACAKACDKRYMGDNNREDMETKRCAAAIRERK